MTGLSVDRLPAWAGFGAVLSASGLPIYIYAPKFYADQYGVSLAALGVLLFALRLFDVVQDPALGWLSERLGGARRWAVGFAALVLAVSMVGLFAIAPPISPYWWFGLTLTALFSAFSFLSITFYAQGIGKASRLLGGHLRLAGWRESGALIGVCLAAIAPSILALVSTRPNAIFAVGFAACVVIVTVAMRQEWTTADDVKTPPVPVTAILADRQARRLLLLSLVNATPLAVSSTLFLFFVESRLEAPGWEGPLLVLFFLAAALSATVWSRLAQRFGEKPTLLAAMTLAIASFGGTLVLEAGDVVAFGIICLASGAAIGADLTLLPAMFARRLAVIAPKGGQGFGLWSMVGKFSLAFAAVLLLPVLQLAGFQVGNPVQPAAALFLLTLLYALVPSFLKLVAIGLLIATKLEDV